MHKKLIDDGFRADLVETAFLMEILRFQSSKNLIRSLFLTEWYRFPSAKLTKNTKILCVSMNTT